MDCVIKIVSRSNVGKLADTAKKSFAFSLPKRRKRDCAPEPKYQQANTENKIIRIDGSIITLYDCNGNYIMNDKDIRCRYPRR